MQAKLVVESGEVLNEVWAHDAREIKSKLAKLAAYTAKQGLTCRVEVWHDADDARLGDRQGTLKGYFGPSLGLQDAPGLPDWYQGKAKNQAAESDRKRKHPFGSTPHPSIYLLPDQADYARAIGNGNLSAGIRAALDAHKDIAAP